MVGAREIYQDHLDRVARALWERDFTTVAAMLGPPNIIALRDAEHAFDAEEDLVRTMVAFRDFMDRMGATGYLRICELAAFDPTDAAVIHGRHRNFVMRGGRTVIDPWHSEMTLIRQTGGWKGVHIRHELRNSDCSMLADSVMRRGDAVRRPPLAGRETTAPPMPLPDGQP